LINHSIVKRPITCAPFVRLFGMRKNANWGCLPLSIKKVLPPSQVFKRIQVSRPEAYLDKDFLQQKYVTEMLSTTELAALTFSSKTTILKYLRLHGIPIRASGKNVRPVRSVGFGQRIVNRQVIAHRKELELIEKMRSLRAEGLSYWKIADVLNAWKVPTKTRKGRWHARSVQQILDRSCLSSKSDL